MIAREGLPFIAIGLTLTLLFILGAARWNNYWLFAGSLPLGVLTIFCTFFFRDPDRTLPDQLGLLASADGTVVQIRTLPNHPFVGQNARQISIFLSVFDVHVNRVPADGVVEFVRYRPGKFLVAFSDKASDENEHTEIGMVTQTGHRIVFKQIAGIIARRIVCRLQQGDTVSVGERFGMIRFGSRLDLILPQECEISVKVGDRVLGGQSILAKLPEALSTKEPGVREEQSGN